MQDLASAAAAIGAAMLASPHLSQPIAVMDYGRLRYEIRAVYEGAGLGGIPPYCAAQGADDVVVVYRVINLTDRTEPAAAAPRIELVDPANQAHERDAALSDITERKALPFLSFRHGELAAHEAVVLADVFIVPQNALGSSRWKVRPAILGADMRSLPPPKAVVTLGCPRLDPTPPPMERDPAADAAARPPGPPP